MKRIFISIICITLLSILWGCLNEDEIRTPDGVWCYTDTKTNASCILTIGGANAVSSGGIYTCLTICDGTDNYDIMIGGTLFNDATDSGKITFSEGSTGKINKAYFLMLDDNQITLRMGEGENKTIFLLTKTNYPQKIVGLWGGNIEIDKKNLTINCNLYPTKMNDAFGIIILSNNNDASQKDIYYLNSYNYNPNTGKAIFNIHLKDEKETTMRGALIYNYEHDILEGIIINSKSNKQYKFMLSPSLTLETLQ